ncbi:MULTISPECIES: VOC family protein [unclassified Paenibacillus]|uniref:VOC family protein n=1 Tax=unclassified Paenibacillus TaxID=185978 RepID=UPI00277E8AF5|nr:MULTISPECIES: VOC family protein [unclassified Paenibacillus]MDQ0899641.1 catechol 2,3-dioxygenase [Paenibacillus sp. V4I7]MDQ0914404.1 catechol 2,3-dioxygenase [Paenibacillus sp. V4I5]
MKFHQQPITFVSHVHLIVEKLERSLSFYQGVLGFQLLDRTETSVSLTLNGKDVLVTLEQPADVSPKEPRRSGLYHYAILLPDRKELAKVIQHFIDIKYPLQGISDHLVSEALYLADPDGNGLEIYVDRPSENWEWIGEQVSMATEQVDLRSLLSEANGEKFTGLPTDTIMGHIHLHVSDLAKAAEFYVKGLGFKVVYQISNQALFISSGGYHHHIGLNIWNGKGIQAPSRNSVGLKYYTIVFADELTRDGAKKNLELLGYPVNENTAVDPSGNHILFVAKD